MAYFLYMLCSVCTECRIYHHMHTRVMVVASNETVIVQCSNSFIIIIMFLCPKTISKQSGKYDFLVWACEVQNI